MTVRRHVYRSKPCKHMNASIHVKNCFYPSYWSKSSDSSLTDNLSHHHLPHHHLPHQLPDAGLHGICQCSKPVQFHQDIATKKLIVHMDAFTEKMINETNSFALLCSIIGTQLQKEYHAASTVVLHHQLFTMRCIGMSPDLVMCSCVPVTWLHDKLTEPLDNSTSARLHEIYSMHIKFIAAICVEWLKQSETPSSAVCCRNAVTRW